MRTGGCQCGSVRYECGNEPIELYICHCTECRKQSASAFGISYEVARADFRLTQGTPRFWTRNADSGRQVKCAFCPACGSRIWHQSSDTSDTITVKGGSLDQPVDISEAVHIWTSRKLPSVTIPDGATRFEQEPE